MAVRNQSFCRTCSLVVGAIAAMAIAAGTAWGARPDDTKQSTKDVNKGKSDNIGAANGPSTKGQPSHNVGKATQFKTPDNLKTPHPPISGNKSSVDDVRKRLVAPKDTRVGTVDQAKLNTVNRQNVQKNAFQERMKAGDFNRLTSGKAAQQLKLADQYRLYQKGDVARQLNLQKHGVHPTVYRGVVSPAYERHCVQISLLGTVVLRRDVLVSDVESLGGMVVASPVQSVLGSPSALVPAGDLSSVPGLGLLEHAGVDAAAGGRLRHVGRSAAGRDCRGRRPTCNWWRCGLSIRAIPRRSWDRAIACGSATTAASRSRSRST